MKINHSNDNYDEKIINEISEEIKPLTLITLHISTSYSFLLKTINRKLLFI